MTVDPTSRRSIKDAEKISRLADRQRSGIVKGVMGTPAGRAYMHDRLLSAHIFATSFNHNALMMAFAEGERSQGLQLLNDIMQSCPDQYVLMMREKNERDISDAARSERIRSEDRDGGNQVDFTDDAEPDAATG